jgi:ATP-dependent protease ClpP protease subunit
MEDSKPSWYAVKNLANGQAEIALFDEIGLGGIGAKEFIDDLKKVQGKRVTLRIHSPGGEIFDGHAIYNALRRHQGGVDVAIDGLAASMASVIAMVGEKRSMSENAYFMVHNPLDGYLW